MTDETPPAVPDNVLALRPREPIGPAEPQLELACWLYEHTAANHPRPLAVVLEHMDRRIGVLATFEGTDEGRAQAEIAAEAAINAIVLLRDTPAPAGGGEAA